MIDFLVFGITSLGLGVLLSIPGLILGYLLEKSQVSPNRYWLSLIFCTALVLLRRVWFPEISNVLLGIIVIIGSTLGVYRMDIYWAFMKLKDK